jgi:hypothetical protein
MDPALVAVGGDEVGGLVVEEPAGVDDEEGVTGELELPTGGGATEVDWLVEEVEPPPPIQEGLVPAATAATVNVPEKLWAPMLSLTASEYEPTGRSAFQVNEVPVCGSGMDSRMFDGLPASTMVKK